MTARRVVSLVPSETESVALLAGVDRLVGRTIYCEEPRGAIERIATVGGTKDVDVDAVVALAPDLVLANREENTKSAVERLIARGLNVHVSFPVTATESLAYLESLAVLLDVASPIVDETRRSLLDANASQPVDPIAAFAPIWLDPLMTFDARTFASDMLELCGARNVFADRPRRYPLAADLGKAEPMTAERVGDRDTRYPRITFEELAARAPSLVLLPDEPYAFTAAHVAQFAALPSKPRVELISGKLLFWYGARMRTSIAGLRSIVAG